MKILTAVLLPLSLFYISAAAQNLQPLRERYRAMLVSEWSPEDSLYQSLLQLPKEKELSDQMVQELTNMYPADLSQVNGYLSKVQPDGSFSDINYQDNARSGWQPKQHAERVLQLAKLYATKGSPFYRSDSTISTIHRLLRFWFTAKPVCRNWWQNQIGVPKVMGEAFIILGNELSPWEHQQAVELMRAARIGMTGQNKVWLSQNVLMRGLIENDPTTVKQARDTILSEIKVGGKEGIRSDWSYQLHGPQQQFGNYGLAFLSSMSFFYKLFEGTPYALNDSQKLILTSLIDKGYRWVIWHRQMDISALDRQLYHNVSAQKGLMVAMMAERLGLGGFPAGQNNLVGHKHFYDSDYTLHRTKQWMASLKMSSLRTIGSEHVNEDNLYGFFMGDGATYYYNDSGTRPYMDALPIWDWRKVPGTTTFDYKEPKASPSNSKQIHNNAEMVGGIGSGDYGMSAMDYCRDGVKARKAWLFGPQFVLCLGSGISADSTLTVSTTVDQRASSSPVMALSQGRWSPIGHATLTNRPRLYHDGMGYIALDDDTVRVVRELRNGSWSDNMRMYTPCLVADTLLTITIPHGLKPHNATYQYLVMPSATPQQVAQLNTNGIQVLINSAEAQLAALTYDGTTHYWGVFYEPTTLPQSVAQGNGMSPGIYHFTAENNKLTIIEQHKF